MKEYLKYIGINLVDYSDDELKDIYNEISVEYGKTMEMWSLDLKTFADENPNLDPYSFWGGRKLNKVSKKYAKDIAAMEMIMDDIEKELGLRGKYEEEQKYSGSSNFKYKQESEEEFLEREDLKTLSHKQKVE